VLEDVFRDQWGRVPPAEFVVRSTGYPEQTVAVEDATAGAQAARVAGMRVAAIRGLGYDPSSGYADVIIDRLAPEALEPILAVSSVPLRS
jgi:hypothetical protein